MEQASEDKKSKSSAIKLPPELSEKIGEIVKLVPGTSVNSFGVSCVEAILMMIETPENQRTTPAIVRMVDGVRKPGPLVSSPKHESEKVADAEFQESVRRVRGPREPES